MSEPEADEFLLVLGLFRALEDAAEAGRDLPDPTVDSLFEAIEAEIGTGGMLSGWAIVAAVLRKALLEHSRKVGCSCGDLAWLQEAQLVHYDRDHGE